MIVPCKAQSGGIKQDPLASTLCDVIDPTDVPAVILGASETPEGAAAVVLYRVGNAIKNAPGVTNLHHIFPREFASWFSAPGRGIDIDAFTVQLQRGIHLAAVHGKGTAEQFGIELSGRWNTAWETFIANNPNASAREVYDFAGRLMETFHLNGLPIIPYR